MAVAPSVVIALRDGASIRALRHYHQVTSDEVGRTLGRSGRRVRQLEAREALEPELAEWLRSGIEAAVVERELGRKDRSS